MAVLEQIRFRIVQSMWPVMVILLLIYLGYHSVNGQFGLFAYRELSASIAAVEGQADSLRSERMLLEGKVSRLRPDNIDPELLGERARAVLGFGKRDEIVILLDDPSAN